MKCSYCDWESFNEEGGFYYCQRCNQQCEGFQLQVADEDHVQTVTSREVGRKRPKSANNQSKGQKRGKFGKNKERPLFSKYTDLEANVLIYIGLVEDFVKVCKELDSSFDSLNFTRLAYKLLIKYLRESEIAFSNNENTDPIVKYCPNRSYRDKCLINKNTDDIPNLPFFERFASRKPDKGPNIRTNARKYVVSTNVTQNHKYYDSQLNFKDSRLKSKLKKVTRHKSGRYTHEAFKKLLGAPRDHESDQLVDIIQRAKSQDDEDSESGENISEIQPETPQPDNGSETTIENISEEVDVEAAKEQEDQKILSQLSSKSRLMFPDKPIEFFRNPCHNSIKSIDHFSGQKIIILLYIAIRQWNIKLYFCDLLRWIDEGSLRFDFLNDYFPKNYELSENYAKIFRSSFGMSSFIMPIRYMPIHLDLAKFENVQETFNSLIRRIIYDFNLPIGLLLLVELRYKALIVDLSRRTLFDSEAFDPPQYDQVALCVIILTLRDLFTLDNPNAFWTIPRIRRNLFNPHVWLRYSQTRVEAILSNLVVLSLPKYDTIINPLYAHFAQRQEVDYALRHKDNIVNANFKIKFKDFDNRFQLREQYEFLFGDDNYTRLNETIKNMKTLKPSLYPLTSYSEEVLNHCQNDHIKTVLQKDFRKTLIVPYFFWNREYFFRKQKTWTKGWRMTWRQSEMEEWVMKQHPMARHLFFELVPFYYQSNLNNFFFQILHKIDSNY